MESPAIADSESSNASGGADGDAPQCKAAAQNRIGVDDIFNGVEASMVSQRIETNSRPGDKLGAHEVVPLELNCRKRGESSDDELTSIQGREPRKSPAKCGTALAIAGPIRGCTEDFLSFGGGRVSDGEEALPSISGQRSHVFEFSRSSASMDTGGITRSNGHTRPSRNKDGSGSRSSESAWLKQDSILEIVKRLSEPLGMAVATVFYEVLEQGEISERDPAAVDGLSRLLEGALKESLRHVLGAKCGVFVAGFRNAFRGTFKTRRSVRRALLHTGGWMSRSREVSSSRNNEGIRKDGSQVGPGGSGSGAYSRDERKRKKSGDAAGDKLLRSSCLRTPTEDKAKACFSTAGSGRDGDCDDGLRTSGESCLDGSLQSFFFTDSNGEDFEIAESGMTERGSRGSISDTRQPVADGQSGSPPSQPTPDARDLRRWRRGSEESEDYDIFYSSNVSEAEKFQSLGEGRSIEASSIDCNDSPRSSTSLRLTQRSVGGSQPVNQVVFPSASGNCSPASLQRGDVEMISFGGSVNTAARRVAKRSNTRRRRKRQVEINSQASSVGTSGRSGTGWSLHPGEEDGSESCEESGFFPGEPGQRALVPRRPYRADMTRGLTLSNDYGIPVQANQAFSSRYLAALEDANRLKYLEIDQTEKRIAMKGDHFSLQSENNALIRETIDIGRCKIELKEQELEHRELRESCQKLSQDCADELVAGLCLMLVAICYSTWKFSSKRLSKVLEMCQQPAREPRHNGWFGMNWMSNSVEAFAWQMRSVTCEVTKAGRMVAGLVVIAFIAAALFKRSVTSYSQAMPVTIIVVVLACLCGFAGKISIDSLGGSGNVWVLLWEMLCFLHVFATSFTPWLHHYLYGPPSRAFSPRKPLRLQLCSICARFSFHSCLALVLPLMAGLLPFATIEELMVVAQEFLVAAY